MTLFKTAVSILRFVFKGGSLLWDEIHEIFLQPSLICSK